MSSKSIRLIRNLSVVIFAVFLAAIFISGEHQTLLEQISLR